MSIYSEKVIKLAKLECQCWQAHHGKNKEEFIRSMTEFYTVQFDIDEKHATAAVLKRVEAAKWHDKAEEYEDMGNMVNANIYRRKCEKSLREHFSIFYENPKMEKFPKKTSFNPRQHPIRGGNIG